MTTEECQRESIAFVSALEIFYVFFGEDPYHQEPRRVVRGPDAMPLNMTHLVKHISKLLRLLSLIPLVPSLTRLEEIG